jgi:hypothetical protein
MEVVIQPELQARPDLADLARRASRWLEQAIGEPSARVKAVWGLQTDDRGRDVLELTLNDWTGSLAAQYSPEELQSEPRVSWRFIRQWGDLLQEYWHRRVRQYELQAAEAGEG